MTVFSRLALLLAALWLNLTPVPAQDVTTADRLDQLFAELKTEADTARGRMIENEIVAIWHHSGDDEIDRMMEDAVAAMDRDQYDIALGYLDSMVKLRPDFAEGWNKRATVYFLQGRYPESIADIEKTLALEPRHFGALMGLGQIMIDLGETGRAVEAFKAAVAVNPTLDTVRREITVLEAPLGDPV